MTKRTRYAFFILALCFGIGACSGPTAPTPGPTITQVTVAPQTSVVPAGTHRTFQVSDGKAICKAVQGKMTQDGTKIDYTAPESFGGIDEIRCDLPGAQSGVAHVTVSRSAVMGYNRPSGVIANPADNGGVKFYSYSQNEFGWSESPCDTSFLQQVSIKTWECVRNFTPGVHYVSVRDVYRSGGAVSDNIYVWGVLIKDFVTIPGLTGRAAKFEITADYNVK